MHRRVACSKAQANSSRCGSLQAEPMKLTPNSAGLPANPSGKGRVGSFGINPKGPITLG